MYKKKYLGIAVALFGIGLMLAFTLFWGCTEETLSPPVVQGDLDDPTFTAIRANLDSAIDSIAEKVHTPLTNPWGLPLDSSTLMDPEDGIWWSPQNPADSVDYDYSDDGWHTMYVYQLTASGSQIFYDSIAFYMFGIPLQDYPRETEQVKYRGSYQREIDEGNQLTILSYTIRADYDNVNTYTVSATGTAVVGIVNQYSEGSSNIIEQLDYDISFQDIQYTREDINSWSEYSGISGDVEIGMTCVVQTSTGGSTDTVDQTWTIEITFEENIAHVNATYGNTCWTYDHNL